MTRTDHFENRIAPSTRLVWGLILILTMSLTSSWILRALLTLFGFALARLSGKRISLVYFGFLILSVVVFHLFVPFGKVLVKIGGFSLTEGALFEGLMKGLTLSGLVFLSLASVSRRLTFPGWLGALWGKTFAYYERLFEVRKSIDPRNLFQSLDAVLEEVFPTQTPPPGQDEIPENFEKPRTRIEGWALVAGSTVAALVLGVWLR